MNKQTLVFATANLHKLEEVNQKLADTPFIAVAMKTLGVTEDIPETGNTMEENAHQKAQYLYDKLQIDCFAEDSGLEIEALDMAPGIYTARYAGPQRNNDDNMEKVLSQLQDIDHRQAQFRAVISLRFKGAYYSFEGIIKGTIAHEKTGEGGFGYDPIFIPEGYDKSFAELDAGIKTSISHRAKAVNAMVDFLLTAT